MPNTTTIETDEQQARGDFMLRMLQGWAQSRGIPNSQVAEAITSDVPFILRPDQLVDLMWFVCEAHLTYKARQAAAEQQPQGEH